jgi:nanoRNase/pAp phosphatase (c-di-AMP/oligoRNAs hydrolase)
MAHFRLLTRSDFDGLVCAVLLRHLELVDEIRFVHPKDMQDGRVPVTDHDISANLPWVPGVHLAFDRHLSEVRRHGGRSAPSLVIDTAASSTARVVYDHYGGVHAFPAAFDDMLSAVDKAAAGSFSIDDVLHPKGWELLSFLMDARTGLGRFRDFRISNYSLMRALIEQCLRLGIDELLDLEDVRERVELYFEHEADFQRQIRRCTVLHGDLALLDLRAEPLLHAGNRYMVFALFPECSASLHVFWGLNRANTVFAANRSVFNRRCAVSIGELMLRYRGGGNPSAGICQVENTAAKKVLGELIEELRST